VIFSLWKRIGILVCAQAVFERMIGTANTTIDTA
jgi:hypothetical protein